MRGFTKAIVREISLGAIGGFGYGLLLASVSTALYYGEAANQPWTVLQLSSAVSLSVVACMTIAASVGGAVPFLFTRLDIDPAVATGPIVTTSVDIFGILTYFLIAQAILGI
jgi:magnesium transporter